MSEKFNFRNADKNEVQEMNYKSKVLRKFKEKYLVLSQLLKADGKEVDITKSPEVFEAINREKMDFETIMNLHPQQVNETIKEVERDKQYFSDGKYWDTDSKAKWGLKGHIPVCVYYSRPAEYWKDERLVNNFFNMFPKFRISTKSL